MPFWIQTPHYSDRPVLSHSFDIHGRDDYWPPFLNGYPLTAELRARLPDHLPIEPPEKRPMPDIFNLGFGGSPNDFVVNDRVRLLIEELEPGVHTFIAINLLDDRSGGVLNGYYLLYVGQTIDAVVIEKSDFKGGFGADGYAKGPRLTRLSRNRVLDAQKITGKHLWRGGIGKMGGGGIHILMFCSVLIN